MPEKYTMVFTVAWVQNLRVGQAAVGSGEAALLPWTLSQIFCSPGALDCRFEIWIFQLEDWRFAKCQ